LLGLGHFSSLLILYTSGRTPWAGDQPIEMLLPTHRTTQTQNKLTQYRHLCLGWDSNPRPQRSSGRRQFLPYTTRPLWSADAKKVGRKPNSYYVKAFLCLGRYVHTSVSLKLCDICLHSTGLSQFSRTLNSIWKLKFCS
jgi:hypothetical protein